MYTWIFWIYYIFWIDINKKPICLFHECLIKSECSIWWAFRNGWLIRRITRYLLNFISTWIWRLKRICQIFETRKGCMIIGELMLFVIWLFRLWLWYIMCVRLSICASVYASPYQILHTCQTRCPSLHTTMKDKKGILQHKQKFVTRELMYIILFVRIIKCNHNGTSQKPKLYNFVPCWYSRSNKLLISHFIRIVDRYQIITILSMFCYF